MRRIKEWLVQAFKGFTLMELLIVVIIIGILAALAIPQYTKTIERAHWAEAIDNLGQIRSAEIRYFAERDAYTSNFGGLDITDPNTIPGARYSYELTNADRVTQTFTIRATRIAGRYTGACIALDEEGNWEKREMYDTDGSCGLPNSI